MLGIVRSVISPIWSIGLLMLGSAFFLSFISMKMKLAGMDATVIGYVHSAYYFGLWVGAMRVERLIRRIGHIRAFAAFIGITVASMMIQGLNGHPLVWVVMRFFAGISLAGVYVVIESWLLDKSTLETRGQILAIYMISIYGAQSISQFILDGINITSAEPFLVAGLICSLSAIPVATTRAISPELHEPTLPNILELFKIAPFGCLGCILAGFILSAIYSFTPNYALATNVSVSWMVSLTILGGVLLQWPIGKLSDLYDRRNILIMVSLATIIPAIGILYFPGNATVVYPLVFVLGGLCFTLYPLSITQVCDHIESHNITAITGVLLLAYGIGAAFGPLTAPLLMKYVGPSGLYIYIAIIAGILSFVGICRHIWGADVPKEDQGDFVPLPRSGSVALDLDPRTDEEEESE